MRLTSEQRAEFARKFLAYAFAADSLSSTREQGVMELYASDLARCCDISPVAASRWLKRLLPDLQRPKRSTKPLLINAEELVGTLTAHFDQDQRSLPPLSELLEAQKVLLAACKRRRQAATDAMLRRLAALSHKRLLRLAETQFTKEN